jgi:[histone H3]-lysine36 N-trimethyltransferase
VRLANGRGSAHQNDKMESVGGIVKRERGSPSSSQAASRAASISPGEREPKQESETITTPENATGTKPSRKASQKIAGRIAPLFDHLADATEESLGHFQIIHDCLYGSRNIGSSDNDALDCDCAEDWRESATAPL